MGFCIFVQVLSANFGLSLSGHKTIKSSTGSLAHLCSISYFAYFKNLSQCFVKFIPSKFISGGDN